MRYGATFLLLSTLFLLAGCRGPVVMINGEPVEVLTPKEELELACIARSTLLRSKVLTAEEKAVIREKDPQVKIVYSSRRTGDATISWQLSKRWVAVFIRGSFFTPSAQWMMKIRDNQPEWLDLRGQKQTSPAKK